MRFSELEYDENLMLSGMAREEHGGVVDKSGRLAKCKAKRGSKETLKQRNPKAKETLASVRAIFAYRSKTTFSSHGSLGCGSVARWCRLLVFLVLR